MPAYVQLGVWQRQKTPLAFSCDFDTGTGIVAHSAHHRQDLNNGLVALKLQNTGIRNGSNHRHRLAAELADNDGHLRLTDEFLERVNQNRFKFFHRQAGSLDFSDHRKSHIARRADTVWLITDFFCIEGMHGDLIVRPQDVTALNVGVILGRHRKG